MTEIYIKTYGCSANVSDSEMMAGLLKEAQFEIVASPDDAYLAILNICTVKGSSAALKRIIDFRQKYPYKKLVIAGCIAKEIVKDIIKAAPDASLVSTNNISRIVSAVEETIHNNSVIYLSRGKGGTKINFPKIRRNPVIGIVPIGSGCLGKCSYCSVNLIKGRLHSYPSEKIIEEVKKCVSEGCKEIWITSQDTGCYGLDISEARINICSLLEKICALEGDFMVRLGMANPNHILPVLDKLIYALKHPKMFKFLHIPVQSGNDEILKAMNRFYTVDDFRKIVKKAREEIPEISIVTDIICGFPGETKEQFMQSAALMKEINFDVVNISRFVPRKNTPAAKMAGQININEKKERSRYLTDARKWSAFERNRFWNRWKGVVIVDEKGLKSLKPGSFVARNPAYKPVIVLGNEKEIKLGQKLNVRINHITEFCLFGEVVDLFCFSKHL